MRALTRPLAVAAVAGAAFLATPAQAAAPAAQGIPGCETVSHCIADPFWLLRPCGPLIKCP